ncbi:twin-arginine translocation signal domain-containing protein [Streptomyces xanthophaeus]|uniref:twin-arginine translocation signal domain-containing protein n=1 Tax=Streptomyces xanthophaeus TaxID=67385 RepID=UPI003429D3F0
MVPSRRGLVKGAAAGGLLLGFPGLAVQYEAVAAPRSRPLVDAVADACARLADRGWRTLRRDLAAMRGPGGAPAGPGWFVVGDAGAQLDPASSHGVLRPRTDSGCTRVRSATSAT